MTNIYELVKCFNEAIEKDKKYVGVLIKMQGFEAPELIINGRANFKSKLAYYLKAYNEDLTLKTFNGIKIVACAYGQTLDGLYDKITYKSMGVDIDA